MRGRRRWSRIVAPVVVVLVLLLAWEFVISNDDNLQSLNRVVEGLTDWNPNLGGLPATILPRPSLILRQLLVVPRNQRGGPDYFWRHTRATLFAALLGFALGLAVHGPPPPLALVVVAHGHRAAPPAVGPSVN